MVIGLGIILGASFILFLISLGYAVVKDWIGTRRMIQTVVAEQLAQSLHYPMQGKSHRAARRPARNPGGFIFLKQ